MTATCSCPPDDCHGGHTINVGPAWVSIPDDRLRQFRDDPNVCTTASERSMAAELLALRARVTTMAALLDAESERGRQRAPIGYAVVTTYLDGRWVQTAPVVSLEAARARARVYAEHEARVVELREVP